MSHQLEGSVGHSDIPPRQLWLVPAVTSQTLFSGLWSMIPIADIISEMVNIVMVPWSLEDIISEMVNIFTVPWSLEESHDVV